MEDMVTDDLMIVGTSFPPHGCDNGRCSTSIPMDSRTRNALAGLFSSIIQTLTPLHFELSTFLEQAYYACVRQLSEFYGKSLDLVSAEEIRQYCIHLKIHKKVARHPRLQQ